MPVFIFDYKRWIDPEQKRKFSWKFSTKYSEQELLDQPVIDFLIQQLGRSKVRIEIVEEEEKPNFFSQKVFIKHDNSYRLDSNPITKILTISVFGLFIYAIFDAIFVQFSYSYMSEPPLELFWFIGVVAAIAAITVQLIKKIPVHVSLILGVLIGLTSGLAGYPATMRYITLLTDSPVETHDFVLQVIDKESKTTQFSPVDYELPTLEFRHFNDYWDQFSKGSIHEFQIIKGENDIWLVYLEPIREKAIRFRNSTENNYPQDEI
ncbi:MAG: hypothetical protein K0U68_13680 [Gammaproteobacteria bacterium]|nr:hypothetical protein [Gammaproteobacteria bacterium]